MEILFFLHLNSDQWLGSRFIATELRRNQGSVSRSLELLVGKGLLEQDTELPPRFCLIPKTQELKDLIHDLAQEYKIRPHVILELIFSPMKRARPFADAFIINKPKKPNGDSDG